MDEDQLNVGMDHNYVKSLTKMWNDRKNIYEFYEMFYREIETLERMSLLDTVELQGIRSVGVGPQNATVIEFLSPLTIICGSNGAGKTTIIEALKYVTTGELPKGSFQAFIHDMRLADRSRVDASVKLKFRDIRGRSCVVTRRIMQSKGAKGKITNKSEESTIAIEKEPGEWKSLSSKVVDCRKEILNLLGLPAAILEYVVFCHQEESSWPLDEPKKLKERFDEIFQVTGYVKAIEILRKELKENQQELRVTEGRLPLLIRQQEEKIELHNEYISLKEQIAGNEKEILLKQTTLKEDTAKKNLKVAELDEAEMSKKKHDMMEAEKQVLVNQIECCSALDYEGGVENLKREIESIAHSTEFEDMERNRKRINAEIDEINAKIKEYVAKKMEIDKAIVELKSTQMMHDKMIVERDHFLETYCSRFNLRNEQAEVLNQLLRLIEKRREDISNFMSGREEKQTNCQKEIDSISGVLAQITAKIELRNQESKRLEEDIAAVRCNLMEAASSSEKLDHLQHEILEQEKELEVMRKNEELGTNVEDLRNKRDGITSKIELLKKEYCMRENAEEIENKIKQKHNELVKFEKELCTLKDKHQTALLDIFNTKEPDFPLRERLTIHARKAEQNLSTAEDEFKIHEKEVSRAQFAVSQIGREVDQLADQISSYRRKITKVVTHENEVETRLDEIKTLLRKSQQDSGRINGCTFLYEQWEEEVSVRKCCPLCEQSYSSTEDSDILKEKIKQKKKDFTKDAEKLIHKVKEYEAMQNELMELVPYVGMLKQSNSEKEKLQENLKKAEEKLHDVEVEFAKSKSERDIILQKLTVIRGVQVDASLMDNIWKSSSDAKYDIKLLEAELGAIECTKRSLSDIRVEIKENEGKFIELINKLDIIQAAASERNKLVEKLNASKELRTTLCGKVVQLDSIKKALDVKEKELEESKHDLQKLETQKPIIEAELQMKKKERFVIQNETKNKEAELLCSLRDVEDAAREIEAIDKKLQDVVNSSDDLNNYERDLLKIETEIDVSNAKMRNLTEQIDCLNSKQERKRRLDDQLRKLELRERIKSLNESLKETEWHGMAIPELREELRTLSEQKKRLATMEKILASSEYAQFKEEFKKEVVKKCVIKRVIEDLANYIRAVDESVVKFHAQKMEEINEVLSSLWEQVYHGNDIETIQIKSESAGENEKKKSYNYRVVMHVGGNEIDMPGRCSAGQKMLASILIRIAISDVFCDKCSIIALDEPTANLDVLKNLGDMLADIISARCANNAKMFQLIVITHDNRFVEHLRQLCRPEWVYSVSKDGAGLSRVKRHRNLEDATMREE
uniref:Zinc-hook domain-containing protein n=1 Tax=Elaeophora elaphi TaxID=1147741 RepID=A0A158Q793_9BILA